ncbi:MAG TPA: thioesterase family protein [Gemmatimonadales bacterium]|jgi:acyl-CoA thioester hydrolase
MHPALTEFSLTVDIPVQWGELDAYGHVNNTVFFRYFESVRVLYLVRSGFAASYERDKIGAILHSTECRFRKALFYPDTVTVGGRAVDVLDDRFIMAYRIVSHAQDDVVADGAGTIVSFDYAARVKTAIPPAVRAAIADLENNGARG